MTQHTEVSFATEREEAWLIESDSNMYIEPGIVFEKIHRNEYIVAKSEEKPVGYLRFSYFWSFIPYVDMIWVEGSLRGKGIGKTMLNFLEDVARRKGIKLILSSSQADEPEPQAWHRKMGFKDAGAIVDLAPIQDVTEVIFVKRL